MMEYLRNYLIFLRRRENMEVKMKPSLFMLLVSVSGIAIGFLLDYLLPHGYFTNMLRGVVSVATGSALFSFGYLSAVQISKERIAKDRFYQTMRERFSHKQRINFSIALSVIIASFILLSGGEGIMYTFKSTIAIAFIWTLVAFSRRNRNEFIKEIYEIPDVRDLKSKREKKEIIDKLKKN